MDVHRLNLQLKLGLSHFQCLNSVLFILLQLIRKKKRFNKIKICKQIIAIRTSVIKYRQLYINSKNKIIKNVNCYRFVIDFIDSSNGS